MRVLARTPERLAGLLQLGVEVRQGDILSRDALESALPGVEAVVHCAGAVSLKPRQRDDTFRANVLGTQNVLDAAAARRLRVLHTSSIATLGPTRTPQVLDEAAPAARLDFEYAYAASKRQAEALALSRARDGQDVVILNPGIMLGPDDVYFSSTEFVRRYLRSELGFHFPGGASFCDVRDVARAYPRALAVGRSGERYILAGLNLRYAEVLGELRSLTGLQRSSGVPSALAELGAAYSEWVASFWQHPLEDLNLSVVRWGSLFNYCTSEKAERELGYRNREFTRTLTDTVIDHVNRGAARASTAKLRTLLAAQHQSAPAPRTSQRRPKRAQARSKTQRTRP